MAAEWWFYHIERTSLEAAVAPLLEKCLERKWRVVVVGEPPTLAHLDAALWTLRSDSFLPHGLEGKDSDRQPVLLAQTAAPENGARVAMLLDGADADGEAFERCLVVFNGADEAVRTKARAQYKAATNAGRVARYFQQTASGASGWVEKTPARPQGESAQGGQGSSEGGEVRS
ncbi:MAG: DNA polymerase III subunit chi [Hyphomonadaceae bacterium]